MQNSKISIIVPVYNILPYIEKCLNSLINQTYENIEIIIVDDGSNDGSEKICDKFAKNYKKINVFHKANGGLSSARNYGLNFATGDYIGFVDGDDYIELNMFERLINNLTQTNADISICSFFMENEDGSKHCNCENLETKTFSNIEALELLSSERQDRYVVAWNKLYKKELFQDIEFPIGKIHEDQAIIHHLFFKAKKISTISQKLYHYVVHKNSLSHQNNITKHFDDIDALFDRIKFYKQNNLQSLLAGVERTMFNLFLFYKHKAIEYGRCSFKQIKIMKLYGLKCYQFFEECSTFKDYTKQEKFKRRKIYKISCVDKINLKFRHLI